MKGANERELAWKEYIGRTDEWVSNVQRSEKDRIHAASQDYDALKLFVISEWRTFTKELVRERAVWGKHIETGANWKLGKFSSQKCS